MINEWAMSVWLRWTQCTSIWFLLRAMFSLSRHCNMEGMWTTAGRHVFEPMSVQQATSGHAAACPAFGHGPKHLCQEHAHMCFTVHRTVQTSRSRLAEACRGEHCCVTPCKYLTSTNYLWAVNLHGQFTVLQTNWSALSFSINTLVRGKM